MLSITNMDNSIKDIRKFIFNQMYTADWSTQGRSDYYHSKYLCIKKDFDKDGWVFSINGSNYHPFSDVNINKLIFNILLFFVKKSVKREAQDRKHDKLKQEWSSFLKSNKEISRDNKINKIIND